MVGPGALSGLPFNDWPKKSFNNIILLIIYIILPIWTTNGHQVCGSHVPGPDSSGVRTRAPQAEGQVPGPVVPDQTEALQWVKVKLQLAADLFLIINSVSTVM